tara:strand:- start:2398 stop:2619 length:222 start_codon:yes stop_codon:yes gene_type:complete
MSNDHAKDRYDPPSLGSDFEEQIYGDVVAGETFRLKPLNTDKIYRKIDETICHDIVENLTTRFQPKLKVYVKS